MDDDVRAVSAAELGEAEGTPGLHRRVAFEGDDYWFGHVEASPETLSGWHHHGDMATVGYVVRGRIHLEFGPGGTRSVEVPAGHYFTVPPHTVHREGNVEKELAELILTRVGDGPPVFPVDGPEPT